MRTSIIAAAVALALSAGCKDKPGDPPAAPAAGSQAPAQLVDLNTSLEPVRAAFNARKGEARFLTLLSPT